MSKRERLPEGVTVDEQVWEECVSGVYLKTMGRGEPVLLVQDDCLGNGPHNLYFRRRTPQPAVNPGPHGEWEDYRLGERLNALRGQPVAYDAVSHEAQEGFEIPGTPGVRWVPCSEKEWGKALTVNPSSTFYISVPGGEDIHFKWAHDAAPDPAPEPVVDWDTATWELCMPWLIDRGIIPIGPIPADNWTVAGRVITAMRERGYWHNSYDLWQSGVITHVCGKYGTNISQSPPGQATKPYGQDAHAVLAAACKALQAEQERRRE